LAARKNEHEITMKDLDDATEKVLLGPERKSAVLTPKEKEITAFHESGHAVVGHILPNTDPIHKISIVSRGMALGVTWSLPEADKKLVTKSEMEEDIATLLAGRVAEELKFGDITTGAANDFERATKTARDMVTRYGMSEKLGPQIYGKRDELVFLGKELGEHEKNYSEEIAAEIDREVASIIANAYKKAKDILTKNNKKLEEVASELVKKETLDEAEFNKIMDEGDKKEGKVERKG
jgi:cell division protease FtsH